MFNESRFARTWLQTSSLRLNQRPLFITGFPSPGEDSIRSHISLDEVEISMDGARWGPKGNRQGDISLPFLSSPTPTAAVITLSCMQGPEASSRIP